MQWLDVAARAVFLGRDLRQLRQQSRGHGAVYERRDAGSLQRTSWIPVDGGMHFIISTQTASSSTTLQFTNLPTSYNTLFLNCTGVVTGSNGQQLQLIVGEGAGPTWETGSHHTLSNIWAGGGSTGVQAGTTGTDLLEESGISNTIPTSYKIYIDNTASSSLYKDVSYVASAGGGTIYTQSGWGYWNNDTNPITGFELVGISATFSGTCSLYGMNRVLGYCVRTVLLWRGAKVTLFDQ